MVRIRFELHDKNSLSIKNWENIIIENTSDYIAIENEKNNTENINLRETNLKQLILKEKGMKSLFNVISIQTVTSCNMTCGFCPINKNVYKKGKHYMSWVLLNKIAEELRNLNYNNQILLFTNNEPLLDNRIIKIISLFRKNCPHSLIKILTNGILLNNTNINELFNAGLSYLTINNYSDGYTIIPSVKEIINNSIKYTNYDIRISVRDKDQILTTRAGQSPNKVFDSKNLVYKFCALPFTDLNISYNGIVTQCCFDALVFSNMGTVSQNSLLEIWNNKRFIRLRYNLLSDNRDVNKLCKNCDFDGFRSPYHHSSLFTRKDIIT